MNWNKILFLIFILINQVICSFIPIKLRQALSPSSKSMPVGKPIKGKSISLCDGDVVAGQICVYRCKICDMPRLFVMNYGSHIGLWKPKKFTTSGLYHNNLQSRMFKEKRNLLSFLKPKDSLQDE